MEQAIAATGIKEMFTAAAAIKAAASTLLCSTYRLNYCNSR
jgi:hypothetical protein